jgi:hypothetical protein
MSNQFIWLKEQGKRTNILVNTNQIIEVIQTDGGPEVALTNGHKFITYQKFSDVMALLGVDKSSNPQE